MKKSSQSYEASLAMGSHSAIWYPTQVNSLRLTPARQADTRFAYSGGMEGWVDLGDWVRTEMAYLGFS